MTPTSTYQLDRLVHDYLLAVALAGADLPEARLNELIDDLSEHIVVARAQHAPTEAGVRTILERLGPPAAIAEAARFSEPLPPPTPAAWGDKALGVWHRSPGGVVLVALLALVALALILGTSVIALALPNR